MGVEDELGGQKRVEHGLDGDGRGVGVEGAAAQLVEPLRVGQARERGQAAQVSETHRGEVLGRDGRQISAAALDVQNGLALAEEIGLLDFDRSIAPAVQDEGRIGT